MDFAPLIAKKADRFRELEAEIGSSHLYDDPRKARETLREHTRLKELLVLNWRQKSTARSKLKLTIEDTLDTGLPRAYTPEIYHQKCSALFEHVYESYSDQSESVYA